MVKRRNVILIVIVLIVVIGNLLILNMQSNDVKENYLIEQAEIAKAISLYNNGEYVESVELFNKYSETRYGDSFLFNVYFARTLQNIGKNEEVFSYYQRAYNINPGILKEEKFIKELSEGYKKDDQQ